jgi:hypothetical protein
MKFPLRISLRLLLAGSLILVAVGCPRGALKPKAFNNKLARANARLSAAAKVFQKALTDKTVNASEVEGAYRQLESALADAKKEIDKVKPPIGSSSGKDLLDKYRAYLDGQQKCLDEYIKPIVDLVKSNPQDPKISTLLSQMGEEAKSSFASLQEAQKAFAEEHKFDITKNPPSK